MSKTFVIGDREKNEWLKTFSQDEKLMAFTGQMDEAMTFAEPYEAKEEDLDNRAELHELIEKLPDKQRQVMQAHIIEDRTYEEIEQDTGLSNGNIRVIISRAKQTIINLWKK